MASAKKVALYDHQAVSKAYFFPRKTAAQPNRQHAQQVALKTPSGEHLAGYWSTPIPGAPTLLYLYGNGGTVADELPLWQKLAHQAGYNLFMVDYPGYGASAGTPTFSGGTHTAKAALDYLLAQPAHKVPGVVVLGRSAGSTFALDAASRTDSKRLKGLILESGIADLSQRLDARVPFKQVGLSRDEVVAETKRDFDHEAKVKRLGAPLMVLHTRHDTVVPSAHSETLAKWAGKRLHKLVLFEAGDHNSIHAENEAEYIDLLKRFGAEAK